MPDTSSQAAMCMGALVVNFLAISLGQMSRIVADHEVWVATIGSRLVGWVQFFENRVKGIAGLKP